MSHFLRRHLCATVKLAACGLSAVVALWIMCLVPFASVFLGFPLAILLVGSDERLSSKARTLAGTVAGFAYVILATFFHFLFEALPSKAGNVGAARVFEVNLFSSFFPFCVLISVLILSEGLRMAYGRVLKTCP